MTPEQEAAAEMREDGRFKCKYRMSSPHGDQDCEWPMCDCDPVANKIIEHFQECGMILVDEEKNKARDAALVLAKEALTSALVTWDNNKPIIHSSVMLDSTKVDAALATINTVLKPNTT